MPTPRKGEKRSAYVSRCLSYPDMARRPVRERLAVCYSMFRQHSRKGAKSLAELDAIADPTELLEACRACPCGCDGCREPGVAYKFAPGRFAIDAEPVAPEQLSPDDREMSIVLPFASGVRRDRVGDLVDVTGIKTDNHRKIPIVQLDHGKHYPLPIGLTEAPGGDYTVALDGGTKTATAKVYFSQSSPVAEQTYHLTREGLLRGGSFGYLTLRAKTLPPEPDKGIHKPGLHLLETELLEVTVCGLPANPDAARKILALPQVCGKSLDLALRRSVEPHAPEPKAWVHGATLTTEEKSMTDKGKGDQPEEKYGAQVLRRVHADLKALTEDCEEYCEKTEHDGVVAVLMALLEDVIPEALAQVEKAFGDHYDDLEPLDAGEAGEKSLALRARLKKRLEAHGIQIPARTKALAPPPAPEAKPEPPAVPPEPEMTADEVARLERISGLVATVSERVQRTDARGEQLEKQLTAAAGR